MIVKRFFLPWLRFHGIVLSSIFCIHAHIHTNKMFPFRKGCVGRDVQANGEMSLLQGEPGAHPGPLVQNRPTSWKCLHCDWLARTSLLWKCVTTCLSDHLGPRRTQAMRTQQHPRRAGRDTGYHTEGINSLKCNMLLKIYWKVLKNNIVNIHAFNLKYICEVYFKKQMNRKIKLSEVKCLTE